MMMIRKSTSPSVHILTVLQIFTPCFHSGVTVNHQFITTKYRNGDDYMKDNVLVVTLDTLVLSFRII